MSQKFNDAFIVGTVQEASEHAALNIARNYALDTLASKGVITMEETNTMYTLAHKVITEGSEDLIPENLELPEDVEDPSLATDLPEDDLGGDLDLSQLEGIILPDAEGNEYVIQNGVIVPYTDGGEEAPAMDEVPAEDITPVEDAAMNGEEVPGEAQEEIPEDETDEDEEKPVVESETPEASANSEEAPEAIVESETPEASAESETPEASEEVIEESTGLRSTSSIVENLIQNLNFGK